MNSFLLDVLGACGVCVGFMVGFVLFMLANDFLSNKGKV